MVQAAGQQVDFAVVKINCDWSKSMSITNLTIVDLRAINAEQPFGKISSVLKQLSTKWDQREVMPPYIDVISGLFSNNIMRKPASYEPLKAFDKARAQQSKTLAGGNSTLRKTTRK